MLGPRLRECARLVNAIEGSSVDEIFGWPDNLKVRSSMTLFARATDDNSEFVELLAKFYGGDEDPATVDLLGERPQDLASRAARRRLLDVDRPPAPAPSPPST